ncbi:hypothetical protein HDE_05160 [Halotydeus destructor]|nr:hypothetical protein HDE_05160 [Halotydeus destructor]
MSLAYYLQGFWEETGDHRVSHLPLMSGGPWSLLALAAAYVYTLTIGLPGYLRQKKGQRLDIQPWLIVYYGFMFGAHGVGSALSLAILDLKSSWSCDPLAQTADVKSMGIIYAAYVVFAIKLITLLEPMFTLVEGHGKAIPLGDGLRFLANVFLFRFAYKSLPGNAFLYIAFSEMLYCTVFYGYQALASSSKELMPEAKWSTRLTLLRTVHLLSLFAHGLQLMSTPSCAMPKFVAAFECGYAILSLSQLTLNYALSAVRSDLKKGC